MISFQPLQFSVTELKFSHINKKPRKEDEVVQMVQYDMTGRLKWFEKHQTPLIILELGLERNDFI